LIHTDMKSLAHPALEQIHTRVFLSELSASLGRVATLDDVPDGELDRLAAQGLDWVWFLGVWQTGTAGRAAALADPGLLAECRRGLPDLQDRDITGSCFAVTSYTTHLDFGGDPALIRLRERLHGRGLRLMLDFVPNHTALDHPWARQHPEFYVPGAEAGVFAHGRDPYFPAWQDTLQLNYAQPALQDAMASELLRIAGLCDGVRCDMAMLILPDVFERTWGLRAAPFWPTAIERVRAVRPDFLFLAEVYWDLEWTLQQQGFDYTYDKRLYDRLLGRDARAVRDRFRAAPDFQRHSARFLENHDEPRAATASSPQVHRAAAVLTFLCPGLRFFHRGQFEGLKTRLPVQLCRAPAEPPDPELSEFYDRLVDCLRTPALREGDWKLLDCHPAWEGNWTWDCFIAFAWQGRNGHQLLVAVNYAPNQSQCYLPLPPKPLRLRDLLGPAVYERTAADLAARGLYLDLPPWGYHVFEVT
jgi:hypothetical protein